MLSMSESQNYRSMLALPGGGFTKPGVRGYPGLEPEQLLLMEAVTKFSGTKFDVGPNTTALDLTARGGSLVCALLQRGASVLALESSAAAMSALAAALEGVPEYWLWLSGQKSEQFDLTCLILPGERGNNLVRHMLQLAHKHTRLGGVCVVAGDKGKGFERYFKEATTMFGSGELLLRDSGKRVGLLKKENENLTVTNFLPEEFTLHARGQELLFLAYPGVFSAGKLDAASALLLSCLPNGAGLRVLDLGCGYGALSGFLLQDGAKSVTMLDDDLFSVASCRLSVSAFEQAQVLHSDVDSALDLGQKFDLVVTNPPFHLGKDLSLSVAQEFIRVAGQRLVKGGELWLVANHFLPYEELMGQIGPVRELHRVQGFKVLVAKLG